MLSIFDGITQLEPDLIRNQLVLLEELTALSIVGEVSQKATKGIVNIVNSFRKITKAQDIVIESIIPLEERMYNKNILLEQLSKEELELRLQKELVEKINSFYKVNLHNVTKESISVNVIEIASKCFAVINKNLTPAKKADAIFDTFNARLIVKINNVYQNASKDEKALLLQGLKIEDTDVNEPFSREIISTDILSFLFGEGNYLISEYANYAITMRDNNQLTYELFAQLVWLSVMMCGEKFSVDEKLLPNFIEGYELEDRMIESDTLQVYIENLELINKDLEMFIITKNDNDDNLFEIEKNLRICRNKIAFENKKIKKLEDDLKAFEGQKYIFNDSKDVVKKEIANYLHKEATDTNDKTIFNINKINDAIKKSYTSIDEMNEQIIELEKNINSLKSENEKLVVEFKAKEQDLTETDKIISDLVDKEEQRIKPLYEETYYKFVFEENVLRSVAKNYTFSEYASVENALMELHEMHDPVVLHNRNTSTSQAAAFNFLFFSEPDTSSKILYRTLGDLSDGKRVFIMSISKNVDLY